jgi:hypothetical protein
MTCPFTSQVFEVALPSLMMPLQAGAKLATRTKSRRPRVYEYKVLTERDSKFSGGFDPDSLEAVLNGYAADGWRAVSGFLATSVWKTSKTDIVVIMERDKPSIA